MKKFIFSVFLLLTAESAFGLGADYTHCHSGLAYTDPARTTRQAGHDWICQLPEDVEGARCPNAQQRACAGGNLPGPHNVPNGGAYWFWAASTASGSDVRCTCGCFAEGTLIETEVGPMKVEALLNVAKFQKVRILKRSSLSDQSQFDLSQPMTASQFTKGAEEKPLVVLFIEGNRTLKITDNHPILVLRNGVAQMIRAGEVNLGETLISQEGEELAVESIDLQKTSLPVINFSSADSEPISHVVVAETIQVGDHKWQVFLDILNSRQEHREHGDLDYLALLEE